MNELFPGIDGMTPRGIIENDGCCPRSFADIDACEIATSYIGLLPNGPLWDRAKYEASVMIRDGKTCSACWKEDHCPTMVDYAVNAGERLATVIMSSLWPAYREADPFTAATSTADWLERFEWNNCFESDCRPANLGDVTPLEYMGECGPIRVDIRYSPAVRLAYESALVKSLDRLSLGIIKNIAAINFVIEPLKVRIVPVPTEDPCTAETLCVRLEKTSDFFEGINLEACGKPTPIRAYVDRDVYRLPVELPKYIWPGHLAAECIVRSLLSHVSRLCVIREQQIPDQEE